MMLITHLLLIFVALFANNLIVEISEISEAKGTLRVAVYDHAETHLDAHQLAFYKEVKVRQTGTMQIILSLPPGTYSLAVYHDLNDDKELNTNFLGMPKEPYGFSNNAMGTFGPPSFDAAKFDTPETTRVSISLH
ncbi:MAG: DUF2141 domain-containing protein [Marinoscillum sp.]